MYIYLFCVLLYSVHSRGSFVHKCFLVMPATPKTIFHRLFTYMHTHTHTDTLNEQGSRSLPCQERKVRCVVFRRSTGVSGLIKFIGSVHVAAGNQCCEGERPRCPCACVCLVGGGWRMQLRPRTHCSYQNDSHRRARTHPHARTCFESILKSRSTNGIFIS